MVSLEQAKTLSRRIVAYACDYIGIDEYSIRVIFAPQIEPMYSLPQNVLVLDAYTIVISETFLKQCCKHGFTKLRNELYMRIRFISQRRKTGGNLAWKDAIKDASAFSMALLLLDGNQLPCPPMFDVNAFFGDAIKILSNEFGLYGTMFKMPTQPYNGAYFYKVRLSEHCPKHWY